MPVGLFGKYPGKRDFVTAGLPVDVLRFLEDWLRPALAESRSALGRHWLDLYMVQPVWNFWISRDIAPSDIAGAVMPSVDGVGRQFPLVIASFSENDSSCLEKPKPDVWYEEASSRLISALDDPSPTNPEDVIAGLSAHPETVGNQVGSCESNGWELEPDGFAEVMIDATAWLRTASERHASFWWTSGGEHVAATFHCFRGMPPPSFFTTMLGGK